MPVNSYSFKIQVPTSSIPIITSCAYSDSQTPPSIIPSSAVPTSDFIHATSANGISLPSGSMLVVINSFVDNYRITVKRNSSGNTMSYSPVTSNFYYHLFTNLASDVFNATFYGTDGILVDTLLYTACDYLTSDNVSTWSIVSTKCLLFDLPE